MKIQKIYWKNTFASRMASNPDIQVRPRYTEIAAPRRACSTPDVFFVDVIVLPDFIKERKMETKLMVLTETHKATGIKKARIAGKPCRRQLQIQQKNKDI